MNRRNFLKSLAAFVGAAAVPQAVVQACQIDAPIPKDWIVGLIDSEGNEVARVGISPCDTVVFPVFVRPANIPMCFVEGEELQGRMTFPISRTLFVCTGDAAVLTIPDILL